MQRSPETETEYWTRIAQERSEANKGKAKSFVPPGSPYLVAQQAIREQARKDSLKDLEAVNDARRERGELLLPNWDNAFTKPDTQDEK